MSSKLLHDAFKNNIDSLKMQLREQDLRHGRLMDEFVNSTLKENFNDCSKLHLEKHRLEDENNRLIAENARLVAENARLVAASQLHEAIATLDNITKRARHDK